MAPVVDIILQLCTSILRVYTAYKDAPEQFRSFAQELLALHAVTTKVSEQLGISESVETADASASLNEEDKKNLKVLYDGLQPIIKELDDLLIKYRALQSAGTIFDSKADRLKWGFEDLAGLRDKVRFNVTMLTAFNAALAKYVPLSFACVGSKYTKYFSA